MGKRHQLLGVVLVLIALAGVAACGGKKNDNGSASNTTAPDDLTNEQEAGEPQPGGTLTVGLSAETNNWNPYTGQWAGSGYFVAGAIFDPLSALDENGEVQPYLAESFTPNDDFTQWDIKLRPDITFHNGTAFDATALKANLDFGAASALTAVAFEPVESVEVVDDLTARVHLKTPWATMPLAFVSQAGYMAAPEMLDSDDGGRNPIGTGPFVFDHWTPDSELTVTKNDNYWQAGLPYLDGIDFKVLPDAQSRTQSMESGEIQVLVTSTPDQLLEWQAMGESGDYQFLSDRDDEQDDIVIALNTSKPPFDDPLAREALAAGIDQEEIAQTLFSGAYPAAKTPFGESSPFYVDPDELGYPKYDLAHATELAQQYEDKHGEPLKFSTLIPTDPAYQSIAQAMQERAGQAGIQVQLQPIEQAQLITNVLSGDYQSSGWILWSSPTLDKGYVFLATDPQPAGLSLNFTRFKDDKIKDAMNAARATPDREEQINQYRVVQEQLAQDLQMIFLVHYVSGLAFDNNVHGLTNATFPGTESVAEGGGGVSSPFTSTAWIEQ
jgi:ABC-type transport system substrate-binding protein